MTDTDTRHGTRHDTEARRLELAARVHQQAVLLLLVGAFAFEAATLGGLVEPSTTVYHLVHLAEIVLLVAAQVALGRAAPPGRRGLVHLMTVGLVLCGVGDFFNSALGPRHVVSTRLTFALVFFGVGYVLYVVAIARSLGGTRTAATARTGPSPVGVLGGALVVNVVAWVLVVLPHLHGHAVLMAGSLLFTVTIYVALPGLGQLAYLRSGCATAALPLLVGSMFIPLSDLLLFPTWLPGNPVDVPLDLYISNWFLYFGAQALMVVATARISTTSGPTAAASGRGRRRLT